jgi:hypothetical protein
MRSVAILFAALAVASCQLASAAQINFSGRVVDPAAEVLTTWIYQGTYTPATSGLAAVITNATLTLTRAGGLSYTFTNPLLGDPENNQLLLVNGGSGFKIRNFFGGTPTGTGNTYSLLTIDVASVGSATAATEANIEALRIAATQVTGAFDVFPQGVFSSSALTLESPVPQPVPEPAGVLALVVGSVCGGLRLLRRRSIGSK